MRIANGRGMWLESTVMIPLVAGIASSYWPVAAGISPRDFGAILLRKTAFFAAVRLHLFIRRFSA
jgi:hypothetical protein